MKVGIITINDRVNIGNRLQNFAVQELLKERGCDVSTIQYSSYDGEASKSFRMKIMFSNILEKIGILNSDVYINKIKKDPKMMLTKQFNKKYISVTNKYFFKTNRMKKYVDAFDYYCAGSDQVWNAARVQNRDFFFMSFAPSEKTFSLSASMGTTYIADKYLDNYIKGFNHVGNISVREDSVKELIKDTVGRDVEVLLDPTLLIDKEKWLSIATAPKIELPPKYIATYFLSAITESQKEYMQKYAQSHGLKIIDLNGSYYNHVGPLEFLYLIANSEFVFTDSFHGTAFSIIFDKHFVVFRRNNTYDMSSRITTILNKCRIENRLYVSENNELDDSFLSLIEEIKNENTDHVFEIIEAEKETAKRFLDKVFNDEKV